MTKAAVTINSRRYDVVAEESEEYIEKLAAHINEKVELVLRGGKNIIGERPIVLAALNICDEYFKLRDDRKTNAANSENRRLKNEIKKLRAELDKKINDQISIDETEMKAEKADAKNELDKAGEQIKFLEGQVALLEGKLKTMEEDYVKREQEILEMIDKDTK